MASRVALICRPIVETWKRFVAASLEIVRKRASGYELRVNSVSSDSCASCDEQRHSPYDLRAINSCDK